VVITIALNFIAAFIFLFILWKKLKEDYLSSQIFNTGIIILFFVALLHYLSSIFIPDFWFWAVIFGALIGLAIGVIRYKYKLFETLEALIIALLPWYGIFFLTDAINNKSLTSLIGSSIIILLIAVYLLLDKHYKKFSWYKSGKVGFSGLSVLGLLFIIRAIVAISFENVLSFAERHDALLSGILAFASFLSVFHLARKKT